MKTLIFLFIMILITISFFFFSFILDEIDEYKEVQSESITSNILVYKYIKPYSIISYVN